MIIKVIIVALYFIVLLGIGWFSSKRIKDISDFFVAGKKLGYWLVSFSSRATGESGWLLLGLTGLGFAMGVHGFWVVLGEVMGVSFAWIFLTQRFKVFTDKFNSITIPDYFENRFHDNHHIIRILSAIVLVVFVTAYVSAQFTATGKAFEGFLRLDYKLGVVIGLVIVLIYTVAGGFIAVVWSDLVQGILMLLGLIVIPIVGLVKVGGLENLIQGLNAIDPALLTVWGEGGANLKNVLSAIGLWGIGLAFLGSPQLFVRFIAVKDTSELTNGSMVAVLFTIFTNLGALLTGMCGRVIYKTLADQEWVLPQMATDLFPLVATGLFIAIVLAAIMSTADSLLLLASSAVVRDIYQRVLNPDALQKQLTRLSRIVTFVVALLALIFALIKVRLVFWFALFGWAGIGSAFCPVIILSLFWRGLTKWGAISGMFSGFIITIIWKSIPIDWIYKIFPALKSWVLNHGWTSVSSLGNIIYEIIPAFFGAVFITIMVSLFTSPPPGAGEDLADVKAKVIDIWS